MTTEVRGFVREIDAKKIIRLALLIMAVVWMAVIFGLSANNAQQSNSLSRTVTEILIRMSDCDFNNLSVGEQKALISRYNGRVRDAAHFGIYALFSFLLYFAISSTPWFAGKNFRSAGLSFVACAAFAFSDEFHQIFVDGRGAQLSDVMLDTKGALLGVFIALITTMAFRAIRTGTRKMGAES